MSRRWAMLSVSVVLLMGGLVPSHAHASDAVPAELALKVMLRVLTYDSGFAQRGSGDFVIAVAYPAGAEKSKDAALAAAGQLAEKTIQGRTLRFVPVEFSSQSALVESGRKLGAGALLAPAGLDADGYQSVANAARELKTYGLALVPAGAEAGLVLGVANNNGRPQVLLHREATQAIGANWPPAVLKLARVL